MGRDQMVPVMMRATGSSAVVNDAGFTEIQISVPPKCRMRRVRAIITAGTGLTVAMQLREVSGVSTGLPVVVDVALIASPMSEGGPKYCIADTVVGPSGEDMPVLYVGLTTETVAPAVDTVEFSVDFESCSS